MDRKEYNKNYRDLNKEEIKTYKKKWYQENKEKIKNKSKTYYEKNKDYILEKRKKLIRENSGEDMNSILKKNVTRNIENGLMNGYWEDETENLLGYSLEDLVRHIKTFDFEYYNGRMHLHHIIPIRVYNFYNKKDIKKCWSLKNLIPTLNKNRSNYIDWNLIEEKNLEHLLPDTLMMDDLIGRRHHEV